MQPGITTDPPPLPDHRCLPEFDLEPRDWLIPPSTSLLICASPRTGSTWVCEELGFRGLGEPLEYFNPFYVHYLSWRWQCVNLAQYRMMLWRLRTAQSGMFAMKVLGMQAFQLTDEVFAPLIGEVSVDEDPAARAQLQLRQLETVAPSPSFVWLRRSNKIEQAVSWWVAEQTGLWMQKLDRDSRTLDGLEFDFDGIDGFRRQAEQDESDWRFFFAANGLSPIVVDYEDIEADPLEQLGALAVQLGGSFTPTVHPPDLRNHVQSNEITARITERYLSELQRRGSHFAQL